MKKEKWNWNKKFNRLNLMLLAGICLMAAAFSLHGSPSANAEETSGGMQELEGKRILFISSYSESFVTVPDQIKGLSSVLTPKGISLDIEYMDTKRFSGEEIIDRFYESLTYKLKKLPVYDAIIAGDDAALQFAMDYQKELFPEIPIIFFGINDKERAKKADANPYMAGGVEETSLVENIELALRFNPKAKRVVGIIDGTLTGQGDRKQLEDAALAFPDLEFTAFNASECTFEEFGKKLEALDNHCIILFQSMNQDGTGAYLELEEQFAFLRKHTKVPIYRASVGGIGDGLLGGWMIDYEEMGRAAAEMTCRVLSGTPIHTIALLEETPHYHIFDYDIIQKYGIDQKLIPEGAVLFNKEISPLERYRKLLIGAGIVFVVLAIFTIILFIQNIRYRKMQRELQESHEQLVSTYEELTASEEELKSQYEKIEIMAKHDYLTNLPNRLHFLEELSHELEIGSYGVVMLLDIDNFKGINDTLGHVYGDRLLQEVGERLSGLQDDRMFCARFGGDEFLILIKGIKEKEEIQTYIRSLQEAFEEAFVIDEIENSINFSMGVTRYPKDSDNLDQLIMNVDTAMYKVKHNGKNNYIYYQEEMKDEIKTKKELEGLLRQALREGGFYLCYQPQLEVETGEIVGFEALVRLKDCNISPGIFIPVAEETGHIVAIGRWVAEEAIRQLADWRKKGFAERVISINFSSKQLRDREYTSYLMELLKAYEVSPKSLEIEITESIFLEKDIQTMEFLEGWKASGLQIALDDFGTGYSSLNYLTYIPVDKIKLDKTINDKFLLPGNMEVMNSIISLAHGLKLKITAEGIEDYDKYLRLRESGCDYIQGYLFSKPLIVDELEKIYHLNLLDKLKKELNSDFNH
ncbi:diguanylate cyclase (GGDEF)-like protein [Anaerotaenia torta]|uniref:EAL domain-containing protein n=1 Tax=Anaerotaenia torta TaxID=433293 RepID=UPI003D1D33A8